MATQIVLIIEVEDEKVTPFVTINPYYSNQGFANAPKDSSSLKEGYRVNNLHHNVLDFADKIQREH